MNKPTIITKETLLPLSVVVSLIIGGIWMDRRFMQINYRLDTIEQTQVEQNRTTKLQMTDRWKGEDMIDWAELLAARNPTINVPMPKNGHATIK